MRDLSWAEIGLMVGNALGQGWMNHLYDTHREGVEDNVPEKGNQKKIANIILNGNTAVTASAPANMNDAMAAQVEMLKQAKANANANVNPSTISTSDASTALGNKFGGSLMELRDRDKRAAYADRANGYASALANALPSTALTAADIDYWSKNKRVNNANRIF